MHGAKSCESVCVAWLRDTASGSCKPAAGWKKTVGFHNRLISKWKIHRPREKNDLRDKCPPQAENFYDFGFEKYFGHLSGASPYIVGNKTFLLNGEKFNKFGKTTDEFYLTDVNQLKKIVKIKKKQVRKILGLC